MEEITDEEFYRRTGFWWAPKHVRDEWKEAQEEARHKKFTVAHKRTIENQGAVLKLLADE